MDARATMGTAFVASGPTPPPLKPRTLSAGSMMRSIRGALPASVPANSSSARNAESALGAAAMASRSARDGGNTSS